MADKIKSIAAEEARKISHEVGEGIRTGTYFYPFHVRSLYQTYPHLLLTPSARASFTFSPTALYGNLSNPDFFPPSPLARG